MKLLVHADDLGNSKAISDNILECFGPGMPLSGASIMANGYAFDYAAAAFNKLESNYRLGVHINLLEGPACLSADEIPLLVDKKGYFCHSFHSLLFAYYVSHKKRAEIEAQVKAEMRAQIRAVAEYLPEGSLMHVDGHQHFHMIPFIFKLLLELHQEFPIGYIRIAKEPFFIHLNSTSILNYLGLNLIKHLLLNFLSGRCVELLKDTGIRSPDYFIGVLFTGNVTLESIRRALTVIKNKHLEENLVVEILMHPGRADKSESEFWNGYPHLLDYYRSDNRQDEKELLRNPKLVKMLCEFERDSL